MHVIYQNKKYVKHLITRVPSEVFKISEGAPVNNVKYDTIHRYSRLRHILQPSIAVEKFKVGRSHGLSKFTLKTNRFSQALARAVLRLLSWKLIVDYPLAMKYILIGAPHTSNWDLLFALLLAHGSGIQIHWVGKESLFRPPFGGLMRWLGGIPVNRSRRGNFVEQVIELFKNSEKLVIAITPEGTRSRVTYWKTGFYHIAYGAGVPIALGFIDYSRKEVGIGPVIEPTGDIRADFKAIQAFYVDKIGLHQAKHGKILLNPE